MAFQFTDDNFKKEAIEASTSKPVLVDFFASWCGPCKMQAPIIDEVAEAMKEKAVVGKLDTEANQLTAAQYGVMSIPTLLVFKDGKIAEQFVGLQSKEALLETLEKYS
ncbi:thioredoxin [Candidatus Parcubacteria bacterium]|nr:MAG: thioredoxin [Candidatus Parcubacteria bacterium]